MRDSIDRLAALKALDEIAWEIKDGDGFQYEKWEKYFTELPSSQPEIIKCKDCKHYKAYYCTGCLVCHLVAGRTVRRDLDDFCSRAERREDG